MSKAKSPKKIAEETNADFQLPGIGNYGFVKTLGEGNFAKVKLAKHKMTGQEVAIKIIDKTQLDEKKLNKLYREVRIMKLLHHPSIVRLYEVIETKSTVFLVMEYSAGGELYDYLVVHGRMKEKEARAKFRQILSAVSYCHKKKVIHRDLKAENLLLDANLDVKIADFGFSNQYDPDGKLDTFCGSPPYAAPELFQGRRYVGPEVDVWSLGVILYVLTTGCLPFDGKNLQEMRESVCRGKYRIPFYLSDSCEKFLRKFLVRDSTKRATLDIIADDPWIMEGYSNSPICADLTMKITEDENLIKLIEQKFHIERDVILKSLREGVYDDVSALYYLMYHERDRTGDYSRVNQVLNQSTLTSSSTLSPTSMSPMPLSAVTLPRMPTDNTSGHSGNSNSGSPNSPVLMPTINGPPAEAGNNSSLKMAPIDEDGVAPQNFAATISRPGTTVSAAMRSTLTTPRRCRFTVGTENEQGAQSDNENGAKDANDALKKLQTAVKNDAATSPVAILLGKSMSVPSSPMGHYASMNRAGAVSPQTHTSTLTGGLPDDDGPRKRNSTIVSILRSTMGRSRTSEGGSTSTTTMPRGSPSAIAAVAEDGKPRSLRFTFNSNTTSSKPPDEVVVLVLEGCAKLNVQHKLTSRYLIEGTYAVPHTREVVRFEVEICKLPRLKNLHGLKFKRLSGPSNDYKNICENLLANVSL